MTISERVFERLTMMHMTQKEFSEKTGIQQSTISEWKKNKTNPSSDKIMSICKVLGVTSDWLLSGVDPAGSRADGFEYYTVKKDTDLGRLIAYYNKLNPGKRERIMGYIEGFMSIEKSTGFFTDDFMVDYESAGPNDKREEL